MKYKVILSSAIENNTAEDKNRFLLIRDCFVNATEINIATGYVTCESLQNFRLQIEKYNKDVKVSLFIGMNYALGFTKSLYDEIIKFNNYLKNRKMGEVYVSPKGLFHGAMYAFVKNGRCLGASVGSSYLESFFAERKEESEADVWFDGETGNDINDLIIGITKQLAQALDVIGYPDSFVEA